MIAFKGQPLTSDQSAAGVNDGTIQVLTISDYSGVVISLYLNGSPLSSGVNGTLFGGLAPGLYTVTAFNIGQESISQDILIREATANTTHLKYTVEIDDSFSGELINVRIYDQRHQLDKSDYPKQLIFDAVSYTTARQSEDKTEPFSPSRVDVSIVDDGTSNPDEFALADERTYFVEYELAGVIKFKGWLLPDQVDDIYEDAGSKPVRLYATDGILSLKGEDFGTGLGADMFGIKSWYTMVRQCLDKLGYEYGNITIVKSLQYDSTMDWFQIGCWAELFYDENGVPDNVYEALTKLLTVFNFTLFQQDGRFYLVDFAVPSRLIMGYDATAYQTSFYEYTPEGQSVTVTTQPGRYMIGVNSDLVPIVRVPSISYDNSFKKLSAKIDFNLLAVLFNNGSFEIGSVQGQLPTGMKQNPAGGIPGAYVTNQDAYIGNWSFRVPATGNDNGKVEFINPIPVDQANKRLQFSFNWKVPDTNGSIGLVFSVAVIFITTDNHRYFLRQAPYRALRTDQTQDGNIYDQPDNIEWVRTDPVFPGFVSEVDLVSLKGEPVRDFVSWNSFSIDSPVFPGLGNLYFYFMGTKGVFYDESQLPDRARGKAYAAVQPNDAVYCLYDNVVISQGDAADAFNKQVGETHTVTNLTNFAKSEKKTVDFDLFTYSANKRVAGNLFYGKDYATVQTGYKWSDPFMKADPQGRLPQIVINQIARSYQRPMYKITLTVAASSLPFFSVYEFETLEGRPFIPISIEHNPVDGEVTMTLIETDDTEMYGLYDYLARFERSAKKLVN